MKKPILTGVGLAAVLLAYAAKDPVIMTINGEDVTKSEFEYLYNKNSQQQINPQTLDEYVEMFKLYKMKVADAKAAGLDTTAKFRKEAEQYRHDLATPYLADSVYLNQLVDEAYARSRKEAVAKHIMFFKSPNPEHNLQMKAKADSLKQVLDNGGNFEELARQYSQDKRSAVKGGTMGYIVSGQYPYGFEVAAFATPEGSISDVVESPQGYHILKGGHKRDARGRVKVSHILKLARQESDWARAKEQIDSLYQVVTANPEKFNEIATTNSDDRGSARQGGQLPWFGAGEMVEEFDSAAFALKKGEISKPVKSQFGYHIIIKQDERGPLPKEVVKKQTLARMSSPQDERYSLIQKHQTELFAARHKAQVNQSGLDAVNDYVAKNGIDSLFYAKWLGNDGNITLMTADGNKYNVADFVAKFNGVKQSNPAAAKEIIDANLDSWMNGILTGLEEEALAKSEPDYRNLLKEYVDGSLLYEVSVLKVWDKAAKDIPGLEKYFAENRMKYKWDTPHVKGVFVQAVNDSVATAIKNLARGAAEDDIVPALRKQFKNQMAAEKILVPKGSNAMVDYVAFDGPVAPSSIEKYPVMFMLNKRVLTVPEEMQDVKGLVTSDYQNMFQEQWENELRNKYSVKVNKKVLKSVNKK